LYEDIASVENLFRAAEATLARGRRFRGEGARFKFNMEVGKMLGGWIKNAEE
jgi:hypothetical protein